ncbi:hypothetical protein [Lysobacter sp. HA35]
MRRHDMIVTPGFGNLPPGSEAVEGMAGQQDGRHDDGVLSRGQLEMELASLALAVSRSATERRRRPNGAEPLLAATVDAFLAASLRVLKRTRRAHRNWVLARLADIAASAELGIIGFDEWLATHESHWHRTSDRWSATDAQPS